MLHPLNFAQQSVYFASDLDANLVGIDMVNAVPNVQNGNETQKADEKQLKRKKLLEAQLKSVKMVIPPAPPKKKETAKEKYKKKNNASTRGMGKSKRSLEVFNNARIHHNHFFQFLAKT